MKNCNCEYYDDYLCDALVCSKFLHDEKNRKHEIRYGTSENFLVAERGS